MLEKFREIYDDELDKGDPTPVERILMDSEWVRSFVYEVCKKLDAEPGEGEISDNPCKGFDCETKLRPFTLHVPNRPKCH